VIQIGESVIQLLQSFQSLDGIYELLKFIGVALLILFSLAMQYFDACQVEWYQHALTKSAFAGVSWIWLHVPMTLQLFRLGVWMQKLAHHYGQGHEITDRDAHIFAVSLGVVSLIVTMMRMCNSLPDTSVTLIDTLFSAELRSVLVFSFRLIVSGIQIGVGFMGINHPFNLLLIECGLTIATTVIDTVNDIMAAAVKSKEENARVKASIVYKSLKQFPRQWSQLQLVRKESLLEMNLVSEDGLTSRNIMSSKIPHDHDEEHGSAHGSDHHSVVVDLKKIVETEVLHSARGSSTHYDGLLLRKSTSVGSLLRGPSLRIVPIDHKPNGAMPTLKERNSENRIEDDSSSPGNSFFEKRNSPRQRRQSPEPYHKPVAASTAPLPQTNNDIPIIKPLQSILSNSSKSEGFMNSMSASIKEAHDRSETPTKARAREAKSQMVRKYSAESEDREEV
jgi:hypothetical protein